MKKCELCKNPANTYCESDQASLCWNCDAKVHGANFLVARHTRGLLCQVCRSLTPWRASGAKLGHTLSVCERCMNFNHSSTRELQEQQEDNDDSSDEDEIEEDSDNNDGGGGGGGGDGENQVVPPWSSAVPLSPPAASSSSSSSYSSINGHDHGDFADSRNAVSSKRRRLEDDPNRPCSQRMYGKSGDEEAEDPSVDCHCSSRTV